MGENLIYFSVQYLCALKNILTYIEWIALQFFIKLESGFLNLGNLSFSTADFGGWVVFCCEEQLCEMDICHHPWPLDASGLFSLPSTVVTTKHVSRRYLICPLGAKITLLTTTCLSHP